MDVTTTVSTSTSAIGGRIATTITGARPRSARCGARAHGGRERIAPGYGGGEVLGSASPPRSRGRFTWRPDEANFGELSADAAALAIPVTPLPLKALADYTIIGTPRGRKNARAIVTGAQKYTMDLRPGDVPGYPADAKPAVVLRPPDIKGYVVSINNLAAVQAMPRCSDRSAGSRPVPLGGFHIRRRRGGGGRLPSRPRRARRAPTSPGAGTAGGTSDTDPRRARVDHPASPRCPCPSRNATFDFRTSRTRRSK
jgi:hypothetical protein